MVKNGSKLKIVGDVIGYEANAAASSEDLSEVAGEGIVFGDPECVADLGYIPVEEVDLDVVGETRSLSDEKAAKVRETQ